MTIAVKAPSAPSWSPSYGPAGGASAAPAAAPAAGASDAAEDPATGACSSTGGTKSCCNPEGSAAAPGGSSGGTFPFGGLLSGSFLNGILAGNCELPIRKSISTDSIPK
jgi:hypothetical protein